MVKSTKFTIATAGLKIGVRAYSAFAQRSSFAPILYEVHKDPCKASDEARKQEEAEEDSSDAEESGDAGGTRGRVQNQPYCDTCGVELKPHEIALQVTMPRGSKIRVEPGDLDAMSFEKSSLVEARPIDSNDRMVAAIGFGSRYFLHPIPASARDYWALFKALEESKLIVFIPFIAFEKRRAKVAVVRPANLSAEFFGIDSPSNAPRKLLVLDCLGDSDKLKDPQELPHYPGEVIIPKPEVLDLKDRLIELVGDPLTSDDCVNPATSRLNRAVRRAQRRTSRQEAS